MLLELAVAFALMLVIEGVLYSLFPNAMKRMMEQMLTLPVQTIRGAGLFFAIVGVGLVWLLRG